MSVERKEFYISMEQSLAANKSGGLMYIAHTKINKPEPTDQKVVNAEYVEKLEEALKTIAKGCPTTYRGCTCLENTAQIALGEAFDLEATNE